MDHALGIQSKVVGMDSLTRAIANNVQFWDFLIFGGAMDGSDAYVYCQLALLTTPVRAAAFEAGRRGDIEETGLNNKSKRT